MLNLRIGQGWDRHRLEEGRPLFIGGIEIPSDKGCIAHSDGDVLIHALIDALLGAAALGDIGTHFPPSDPQYKDINSRILLEKVVSLISDAGFAPVNIDSTIVLEKPKLAPHTASMRETLARLTGLEISAVSVKAKTAEKCDAAGRGDAIEAQAVVLLEKNR